MLGWAKKASWAAACAWGFYGMVFGAQAWAMERVPLTLLHTNDLHSHFRAEKTPLGLGGLARMKTALTRIRSQAKNSLLVDGGDWSEGNIYYTEGAGRETLRMMDHLGYDVAVVGNHDWLNGAEVLLRILSEASPSMRLVATNVETGNYDREAEFRRRIPPYVIQDVGGAKVAFIGLLTYEFIYDRFLKPIQITEPFALTRELARRLKKQVDAVVVISHNSLKLNEGLLKAAPDVDLVVGAHDHTKLTHPIVVNRPGAKPAWIVETGCWGRYLGQVELEIERRDPSDPKSKGSMDLKTYRLLQMDASIPEDPETLSRIATLEARIEEKRGPIFHDHVGESEVELSRMGMENLMGGFATDAYRFATGADLSLDHTNFIYGEIHPGAVTTADVFNSNPGVYHPDTDKTWTLQMLPMKGRLLKWMLNLLYSAKVFTQSGTLQYSNVEMVFQPLVGAQGTLGVPDPFSGLSLPGQDPSDPEARGISIKSLKVGGEELEADRTYRVAVPGGVLEALEFINTLLPNAIPLKEMQETGLEGWRVMADYLRLKSPLTLDQIEFGSRVRTVQSDLGLLYNDVRWEPQGRDAQRRTLAKVRVRVRNTGTLPTPPGALGMGPRVELWLNQNGVDDSVDPRYRTIGEAQTLPALSPGESAELVWNQVALPETLGVHALTVRILGTEGETNHSNDEVTRYFVAERPQTTLRPQLNRQPALRPWR